VIIRNVFHIQGAACRAFFYGLVRTEDILRLIGRPHATVFALDRCGLRICLKKYLTKIAYL
jgi:hypothetical protein